MSDPTDLHPDDRCRTCLGCGRVSNTRDPEPWSAWAALPPGSDAAVRAGLVKPVPCPACGGTGKRGEKGENRHE